eukprot:jgi/Phyca11/128752/e_gw1.78.92.1
MPRTKFQNIRSALQFHPPNDPTLDKLHDPLWHSRLILAHFQNRFAEFAVPTGVEIPDLYAVQARQVRSAFLRSGRLGLALRAYFLGQLLGQFTDNYASTAIRPAVSITSPAAFQHAASR